MPWSGAKFHLKNRGWVAWPLHVWSELLWYFLDNAKVLCQVARHTWRLCSTVRHPHMNAGSIRSYWILCASARKWEHAEVWIRSPSVGDCHCWFTRTYWEIITIDSSYGVWWMIIKWHRHLSAWKLLLTHTPEIWAWLSTPVQHFMIEGYIQGGFTPHAFRLFY